MTQAVKQTIGALPKENGLSETHDQVLKPTAHTKAQNPKNFKSRSKKPLIQKSVPVQARRARAEAGDEGGGAVA